MPPEFDFTKDGRRPSAARIVAAWKRAGRPESFTVTYGETFAQFARSTMPNHPWDDYGNGCRGVDRGAVVRALTKEVTARKCPRCGAKEETDGIYTNLAPYSGLCIKCVTA